MPKQYFKKIDFDEFKRALGLTVTIGGDWILQPNGVCVRSLISEEESVEKNVTYVGLRFVKPTDGHLYRTQTDTILFKTVGQIDFSKDGEQRKRPVYTFWKETCIQIPPSVTRRLKPVMGLYSREQEPKLEIELITQPRFRIEDEVHIYD
jgi:hypothetical protein